MKKTSLFSLKHPTRMHWIDFSLPIEDNNTLLWVGQKSITVDADGNAWDTPDLVLDTPWWHCRACVEAGESRSRLSIGAKFCPECGTQLDWEHQQIDEDAKREWEAVATARVNGFRVEALAALDEAGA